MLGSYTTALERVDAREGREEKSENCVYPVDSIEECGLNPVNLDPLSLELYNFDGGKVVAVGGSKPEHRTCFSTDYEDSIIGVMKHGNKKNLHGSN